MADAAVVRLMIRVIRAGKKKKKKSFSSNIFFFLFAGAPLFMTAPLGR